MNAKHRAGKNATQTDARHDALHDAHHRRHTTCAQCMIAKYTLNTTPNTAPQNRSLLTYYRNRAALTSRWTLALAGIGKLLRLETIALPDKHDDRLDSTLQTKAGHT